MLLTEATVTRAETTLLLVAASISSVGGQAPGAIAGSLCVLPHVEQARATTGSPTVFGVLLFIQGAGPARPVPVAERHVLDLAVPSVA
jgi:hypothetical protein